MPQITRTDSIMKLTGFPPAVKNVPPVWPMVPQQGKIGLLFKYNEHDIYHKFSPYTDGENPFGIIPNKQPFVYRYIDEQDESLFNQMDPKVKTLASSFNLTQDTVDDVVRVSKWLLTGKGVQWNVKQLVLQNANPFDETGIYNPISPVVAALSPFTLGTVRPMRHLEGGVFGLLTSTLGISSAAMRYPAPNSTTGDGSLGRESTGAGKGLIRGRTATSAYGRLNSAWPLPSASGGVFGNTFGGAILAGITSLAVSFLGTSAKQPKGTIVKADEATYTAMAYNAQPNGRLSYISTDGANHSSYQFTYAPSKVSINNPKRTKSTFESITSISSTILNYIRNPLSFAGDALSTLLGGGRGSVGFQRVTWFPVGNLAQTEHYTEVYLLRGTGQRSKLTVNGESKEVGYDYPGDPKYEDIVKISEPGTFTNSQILDVYSIFSSEKLSYPSKLQSPIDQRVIDINKNLKNVIDNINRSGVYRFDVPTTKTTRIITPPVYDGFGRILGISKQPGKSTPSPSAGDEYSGESNRFKTIPRSVDKTIKSSNGTNLRMATTFTSDGINLLGVLGKDRKTAPVGDPESKLNLERMYPGWTEYLPYEDDSIAFFFYDVVNEKYIPFRATVKGISEGNTAVWDELRFIGRADQLYSYNCFSRTLSFTFNVVINSVTELLPTWKKLNYMASSVKPSNYTKSNKQSGKFSQFIVPPMFMLTIGDLYKYQPVIITSLNINIPDDASWETLSEYSTAQGWSFLNGMITSPNVGKNFAQVPREAEVAVTCNLLEKERAQVGGNHFGHAPREDDHTKFSGDSKFIKGTDIPFLPYPTTFHKKLVEFNDAGTPPEDFAPTAESIAEEPLPTPTVFPPTGFPTATGTANASNR